MTRKSVSLLVLAGFVSFGTLVDADPAPAQRYRAAAMATMGHTVAIPEAPDHGYRHFVRGGIELTFDSRLSAYVVAGRSDRFYRGEHFLRRHGDRWQASRRLEGPWTYISEAEVPRGLRRHLANKSSEKRSAVPAQQAP